MSLLAPVHTQIRQVWDFPAIKYSLTYPTAFSSTFLSNLYATHTVRPNSRPPSSGNHSDFPVHSPKWSWVMLRIKANHVPLNCPLTHFLTHLLYRNILSTSVYLTYFGNYSNSFTSFSLHAIIIYLANKINHALSSFPDSSVPSSTVGISSSPLTSPTSNINGAVST